MASLRTLQNQGNIPKPAQINWFNPRTDRLVDWLEKHPKHSTAVTKEENRDASRSTKHTKASLYRRIARHVFKNDSNVNLRIAVDHHRQQFGSTGSGLVAGDLSDALYNSPIKRVRAKFPWWDRLSTFWCASLKYNAKPATSAHGQDLSGKAMAVLFPMRGDDEAFQCGMNSHFQGGGWDLVEHEQDGGDGSSYQQQLSQHQAPYQPSQQQQPYQPYQQQHQHQQQPPYQQQQAAVYAQYGNPSQQILYRSNPSLSSLPSATLQPQQRYGQITSTTPYMASLDFNPSDPSLSSLSINSNGSDTSVPAVQSVAPIPPASITRPPISVTGHQRQLSGGGSLGRGQSPACRHSPARPVHLPHPTTPTSKRSRNVIKLEDPEPKKKAELKQTKGKKRESEGDRLKALMEPVLQAESDGIKAEADLKWAKYAHSTTLAQGKNLKTAKDARAELTAALFELAKLQMVREQ
ncbi:hypothetical protein SERLA73DRAFT_157734 [Serpula lacrymans var. lacrymans S7.3]|uniref:Uncharacterized protein n=2 Tax=Serpula lacrymans var. lacrymans TaxID=341189 RepID=F8PGD1_SERL3|nr:uncharacterized protein SERLADRAFT_412382 [Serpula lacrymans var. lacrymans S7.9]EGO04838.1 hypothetical protein SERLA73DRAFT_157734 [Serpula lacrymans var. lacrymans S7.3]EGO30666.1 hypothetical protein SERLADRAFT_412382 [Serpula lacrymans var. lacrymans S7.9]